MKIQYSFENSFTEPYLCKLKKCISYNWPIHFWHVSDKKPQNKSTFLSYILHQILVIAFCKQYDYVGKELLDDLRILVIILPVLIHSGVLYHLVVAVVMANEILKSLFHIVGQCPLAEYSSFGFRL